MDMLTGRGMGTGKERKGMGMDEIKYFLELSKAIFFYIPNQESTFYFFFIISKHNPSVPFSYFHIFLL